ncbi:MAG: S-layer protein [Candidatus Aramenus sulfurataquae]|uniref:S-layer protein n=1 Tax=Candidatus Aramenus sulfurataquae TaxID=1326980 RepID=W7KWV3_9CREN|nr:MAG: S-layer protein [Candidatus Aramenus sulfurataquae]
MVYAFSVAIFLTTIVNASNSQPLILQVVNPVTGQNLAWGRENITLESEYVAVQNLNLTYSPQTAIQVTFKVVESYINNYKFGSSNYNSTAKEFGIYTKPLTPGVTYTILSTFTATTTETTWSSDISPYTSSGNFYYVQFNDTPSTPFYFTYSSTDSLIGTLKASYANVTATISQIPIEVQDLGINSGVVVNVTIQPVLKNLPSIEVPNINFSVHLNYTEVGSDYIVNASYYQAPNTNTYQFINYIVDTVTSVPSNVSQTEGITVSFVVNKIGYIALVDLGLWSNTTTVYVKGINPTPSSNTVSFRPVVIPPSMNVVYSMFGQGNEVLANVTDNYMVANITIYAPDDILDWYLSSPNGGQAYASLNEPSSTGSWDLVNNAGLYMTLYVNGNAVKSINVPLELYYTNSGYVPYVFKAYVSFLLSPTNNIEVAPNAVSSASGSSSMVYVFINPADLKNAMIVATFNDSDYAVQYYFGPIGKASVSDNLAINATAPVIQLPSVASLSQSYIPGTLTDYDYGYHYVVENVTTVMPKYPVLISPQGNSEIIIGQTASPTEASVTLYYPNTPPNYNPSNEVQVATLTSVTIKFQNGTTYKIYLASTNISRLFTSYTWYQLGNVPLQLWQYGFEISLPGLEQILGITPQQATYVLNNSVLSINYYDTITGQTITKNIKLVSLPVELQLIPPNQGKIPIQTIGTPIADLQPGVNLIYNVTATTGFAVEVELSDPTYGQTASGTILSVPLTSITIIGWTGAKAELLYNVNSTLALTETAPGSGLFVGYIMFNISPLGAPINETTLYVDGVKVGTLSQYIEAAETMTLTVTIAGLTSTPLVASVPITGEVYTNVFENVTPLVYNPVTNQLSFYMKATIPYNYSGYAAIQIVNASGVTVFVYETFFQPLPNETMNELIAFDLSLAHLAPGTYKVYVSAFTIPVVYPSTAVAASAKPIEVDFVMTQLTIT